MTVNLEKELALEKKHRRTLARLANSYMIERDVAIGRIATLEAELAPWRRMAAQIEEMDRKGWVLTVNGPLSSRPVKVSFKKFTGEWYKFIGRSGQADTLPAAVDAAYRRVKGGQDG